MPGKGLKAIVCLIPIWKLIKNEFRFLSLDSWEFIDPSQSVSQLNVIYPKGSNDARGHPSPCRFVSFRSELQARAAHAQPVESETSAAAAAEAVERVSGWAGKRVSSKRLSTFEMKLKAKAKVYFFLVRFIFISLLLLFYFCLCIANNSSNFICHSISFDNVFTFSHNSFMFVCCFSFSCRCRLRSSGQALGVSFGQHYIFYSPLDNYKRLHKESEICGHKLTQFGN